MRFAFGAAQGALISVAVLVGMGLEDSGQFLIASLVFGTIVGLLRATEILLTERKSAVKVTLDGKAIHEAFRKMERGN